MTVQKKLLELKGSIYCEFTQPEVNAVFTGSTAEARKRAARILCSMSAEQLKPLQATQREQVWEQQDQDQRNKSAAEEVKLSFR